MSTLLAHFLFRLAHRQAWRVARHDEGRDALAAWLIRIGPRHHGEKVRDIGIGDIAFAAAEQIAVAILGRFRPQARRIGSGFWFCQCETGDDIAACDSRKIFLFLLFGSEQNERL